MDTVKFVPRYGFTIGTFLQKEDPTQFQDHFYGYVINHTRSQSSCSSIITIISRLLYKTIYFARDDLKPLSNDLFSTMSSGDIYERHTHTYH